MPETIFAVCILVALVVAFECGRLTGRREEVEAAIRRELARLPRLAVPR